MSKTSSVPWVWSITLTNTLQDWQNLLITWESLPRKIYHLHGTWRYWSIWCHQKWNYQCSHIQMSWPKKISHSANRCKLERMWDTTSPGRPPNIPAKVSSHMKKHTLQFSLSLLQLLGPWRNSTSFYMAKSFGLNQNKNHLKVCLPRVWHKPHHHSNTYQSQPNHMTLMSGILKVQLISLQIALKIRRITGQNQAIYSPNLWNNM